MFDNKPIHSNTKANNTRSFWAERKIAVLCCGTERKTINGVLTADIHLTLKYRW